jgi:hypothetical protein
MLLAIVVPGVLGIIRLLRLFTLGVSDPLTDSRREVVLVSASECEHRTLGRVKGGKIVGEAWRGVASDVVLRSSIGADWSRKDIPSS